MPYYVLCAGSGSEVEGRQVSVPRNQCDWLGGGMRDHSSVQPKTSVKDRARKKALQIDTVGTCLGCGDRKGLSSKETLELGPQWL